MMYALYRLTTIAAGPLIALYLARRRARGKEDPARFPERLGDASIPRPKGPVVWIHAASVGESLSMLPLLTTLLDEHIGWSAVVTTGTVTSAALMAERLPARAVHQYVPVDRPGGVERFLDHWRPDLALWMESEFWPNLIDGLRRRECPLVLVNGRVSERSFKGWQRFPGFIRTVLSAFDLCLGQTPEDAKRLKELGAAQVECLGNLKAAAPPLPANEEALADLQDACGSRPRWLAASTHAGEELAAWEAHRTVAARLPNLLTVIVPRHATRGPGIRQQLESAGAVVAQRSRGETPDGRTQVYLADTMGELGLFYRLAPIAFIGKSLCGDGGQNPFESARLGSATLFGPNMKNFAALAGAMVEAGAARQVRDVPDLANAVRDLLEDDQARNVISECGTAFASAECQVCDRIAERLRPFFQAARETRHASS